MAKRGKRQRRGSEARLRELEARLRELERAECKRAGLSGVQLKTVRGSMLPGGVTYVTGMANSADVLGVQLKNQPASMLPGGVTYVTGLAASGGKVGFARSDANAGLQSLPPAQRRTALAMISLWPPDGVPPDSLLGKIMEDEVRAELKAKYGKAHERTTIQATLTYLMDARLRRRR